MSPLGERNSTQLFDRTITWVSDLVGVATTMALSALVGGAGRTTASCGSAAGDGLLGTSTAGGCAASACPAAGIVIMTGGGAAGTAITAGGGTSCTSVGDGAAAGAWACPSGAGARFFTGCT